MWGAFSFHLPDWGSSIYHSCPGARHTGTMECCFQLSKGEDGVSGYIYLPVAVQHVQVCPDIVSTSFFGMRITLLHHCFLHPLWNQCISICRRPHWTWAGETLFSVFTLCLLYLGLCVTSPWLLSAFLGLGTHSYIPKPGLVALVSLDW